MVQLSRPEVPPGAHRDLVDALHALHHEAGWPSLRWLAREAGCSHTTVATVFSSPKLPSWGVLELVVEAMGGDVGEFRRLWLAASGPGGSAPRRRGSPAAEPSWPRSGVTSSPGPVCCWSPARPGSARPGWSTRRQALRATSSWRRVPAARCRPRCRCSRHRRPCARSTR